MYFETLTFGIPQYFTLGQTEHTPGLAARFPLIVTSVVKSLLLSGKVFPLLSTPLTLSLLWTPTLIMLGSLPFVITLYRSFF